MAVINRPVPRRRAIAAAGGALASLLPLLAGCTGATEPAAGSARADSGSAATAGAATFRNTDIGCGWEPTGALELKAATQFTVDTYEGGHRLICTESGERFLTIPAGGTAPDGLAADVTPIPLPLDNVYLVSTGMICLIDAIGALDAVTVSSVTAEDSPVPALADAITAGTVVYGGLYRAPDYELITATGCTIAIENTNIDHVPDVRTKLEDLGVTVFTEQSSHEADCLGRLEWIKLMGVLFGREDEAASTFDAIADEVRAVSEQPAVGKTVAFFYINSDGAAVTRRAGDYFSQMIEHAGGTYLSFDPDEATASSPTTVTVEMERFYATARDADVIIYNATIDDSVASIADLVAKNALLADFKAVQAGAVWTCDDDMYQQMTSMPDIILDIRAALTGSGEPTRFVWRLE